MNCFFNSSVHISVVLCVKRSLQLMSQNSASIELMSGLRAQFLLWKQFHCWNTSVLNLRVLASPSFRWWTATLILSSISHHASQLESGFSFRLQSFKHYAAHFCNSCSSFFSCISHCLLVVMFAGWQLLERLVTALSYTCRLWINESPGISGVQFKCKSFFFN